MSWFNWRRPSPSDRPFRKALQTIDRVESPTVIFVHGLGSAAAGGGWLTGFPAKLRAALAAARPA